MTAIRCVLSHSPYTISIKCRLLMIKNENDQTLHTNKTFLFFNRSQIYLIHRPTADTTSAI